ncbi:MAG: DUF2189 domain-containing protein [Taibaiella sp.]|uniref:DUF2189 domain-containing protein n=1 Tax=Sedimenticola sp. TaxID=1940285 RepID=UPI00258ACE46|nr:DUF2189 domain-containing protein [Sedimenticola sp.]MBZ0098997.1 DUF2189 domain-containing protein [Taibaiella sp.]MCW8905416.1 DUF2189 domain-containing protein [Sedimenticola sp.]
MTTYQLSTSEIPRQKYTIHSISLTRPLHWLCTGWRDFVERPVLGVIYGLLVTLAGLVMTFGLNSIGMLYLVPVLCAGFLLIAPIMVVGLYADAKQRQLSNASQAEKMGRILYYNMSSISGMGIILMLVFINWVMLSNLMLAGVLHQMLPTLGGSTESLSIFYSNLPFLFVYIGLGAILAALVFRICVISIPMLVDQNVDTFNAIFVSWKASGENVAAMTLWALLIAGLCLIGFLTMFIGLIVIIPVLGYASWHAYQDLLKPIAP